MSEPTPSTPAAPVAPGDVATITNEALTKSAAEPLFIAIIGVDTPMESTGRDMAAENAVRESLDQTMLKVDVVGDT